MSTVYEAIAKRSSTRGYTAEPVTEEELAKLLEAGLRGPTASNRQEVRFTVFRQPAPILNEIEAEKNRLRGIQDPPHNFYFEAPLLIFLTGDGENKWSALDAGIAVQNMALMAEELGLGSLIIGVIYEALRGEKMDYFNEQLGFPEGDVFQIAFACGHKAVFKEPHTFDAESHVRYFN